MISSKDFKEKWNTEVYPLLKYDAEIVDQLDLPLESKNFLLEAGLPGSAAPFLTFEAKGKRMDQYPEDISIGFTGEGNLLAIESPSGVISAIDHETFEKTYVNASIPQLAESLLEYSEFVKRIKKAHGRRAYLERVCSKEEFDGIKNRLIQIDEKSMDTNSFWWNELDLFK